MAQAIGDFSLGWFEGEQARDEPDIAALVRDFHSLLYRVAYSVVRSPAEAEDVVQETFLRVVEHRGNLGAIEKTIAATPVRRIGKPEDVAAACAFLVSEEAGYITGQLLGVNGGRNT